MCAVISTVILVIAAFISPYLGVVAALSGFLGLAWPTLLRRNIRTKYNVGSPKSWIGDFFMVCCCFTSACSFCQELRAVPVEGWDWFTALREGNVGLIDTTTLGKIIR